jgi:hypothetical protein
MKTINLRDAIGRILAVKHDIPMTRVDSERYTYSGEGKRVGRLSVREYRVLVQENKAARS